MEFLQGLKQPLPVSLGKVSLEGMEPKEMELLGQNENCSSSLTETYCVLRYGGQRKSERVLYCTVQ